MNNNEDIEFDNVLPSTTVKPKTKPNKLKPTRKNGIIYFKDLN